MSCEEVVLITGVSGFFGSVIATQFLNRGYCVVGYDLRASVLNNKNFIFNKGSITNGERLKAILKKYRPGTIIHAASIIKARTKNELNEINVNGTITVCDSINECRLETRLLLISSSAVYGLADKNTVISEDRRLTPNNEYGESKVAQENIVKRKHDKSFYTYKILRPFNLIGPGMPNFLAVPSFIEKLRLSTVSNENIIKVGSLNSIRDYIDVSDAADVIVKNHDNKLLEFQTLNLCSGDGQKMIDVFNMCKKHMNINNKFAVDSESSGDCGYAHQIGSIKKLMKYGEPKRFKKLDESIEIIIDVMKLKIGN
jgi:GDP-4-dehydro-6-deoxy-D-mannose reductase